MWVELQNIDDMDVVVNFDTVKYFLQFPADDFTTLSFVDGSKMFVRGIPNDIQNKVFEQRRWLANLALNPNHH
ncbi:hypothetical protein P7F60_05005 [Rhizobium sp. YJ-22]|uniref:hypothetical protein n=1 Tax=Rhizobium sp. YJ-22 TaxID=3037556 RepID=UPI002412430C|nr:hypothetical protein [Rhizobium sp. YJ-22]MDG3575734.1 hypothetical protein [Rhizobium sp. YJ-22]